LQQNRKTTVVADGYQNNIFFKLFSFKVFHVSFASSQFSYSLAQLEKLCNRTVHALYKQNRSLQSDFCFSTYNELQQLLTIA
ncbi:hypothetical protein V7107_22695, partial [Bacillus toyonensis]